MAMPVFKNPVLAEKPSAKASKLPSDIDPELGQIVPRSDSPVEVAKEQKQYRITTPLFPDAAALGLTKGGKGKKSRKHKKRAHKKTQKRRARK